MKGRRLHCRIIGLTSGRTAYVLDDNLRGPLGSRRLRVFLFARGEERQRVAVIDAASVVWVGNPPEERTAA